MPTYEYECNKCGYRFEEFQKMTEPAVKVCPKCKGKVRRLISSGAGFIFKGSGFYSTDYRSSDYKKKEKEEKAGTTKTTETKKTKEEEKKPKKVKDPEAK